MSVNSSLSYVKYHTWPSQIKAEEWETELLFTDLDYFWKLHYTKIVNIGFILILLKSVTDKYFYGCTKRVHKYLGSSVFVFPFISKAKQDICKFYFRRSKAVNWITDKDRLEKVSIYHWAG